MSITLIDKAGDVFQSGVQGLDVVPEPGGTRLQIKALRLSGE